MLLAPQKDCAKTKRKWHRPWCGDDTCALGWGVGMHRGMVWAKTADHHGAAEAWSGVATEATIRTRKVSYMIFCLQRNKSMMAGMAMLS